MHDWTVECRTEGKGVTREQSLEYLKSLDIGYGYTAEGRAAVAYAKAHGYTIESIAFSGDEAPMAAAREAWPGVRTVSPQRLKRCFIHYGLVGWSGHVPEACRDSIVYLPINYTWLAWGWPNRFVERMGAANSEVFVVGTFHRGDDLRGIPELEDHRILPPDFAGGILTDHIEEVGPRVRGGK